MSEGYERRRLRQRLRFFQLAYFFRIIHHRYENTPLGAVPAPSRFSDPGGQYAVVYASDAVRCSFWEAVARNRFNRRTRRELAYADVEQRLVVTFRSLTPLALVDLRHDGPIRIGAPTAVAHDARHQAGRTLSAAVYATLSEADGFLYASRFTGHHCVAIFDRAVSRLEVLSLAPLVEHEDFLDALDDYEITLTTAPIE